MKSVGSHSTSGREKEGNKERMGWGSSVSGSRGSKLLFIVHKWTKLFVTLINIMRKLL
jgi:hypothetical protein